VMLWRCCVHHGNEEHGLRMGYWLGPELDKGPISKETLVVDGKNPWFTVDSVSVSCNQGCHFEAARISQGWLVVGYTGIF
jgi:hypothetical protein